MDVGTIMAVGKLAINTISSIAGKKSAKRVAREQLKTADIFHKYNKGQIEKAYSNAFSNAMTTYAKDRGAIAEEYSDANSKLNLEASASGINTSNSSVSNDLQNSLDLEYTTGLQTMLTGNMNKASTLVANMVGQQLEMEQAYNSQVNDIYNTVNAVKQKANADLMGNIMNVGERAYGGYSAYSAKNKGASVGSFITDLDFMNKGRK